MDQQDMGQSRRASFHEALTELLAPLYERGVAEYLAHNLLEIPAPTAANDRPAADGCMLVTYADSIQDGDEIPLATLARFLRRYVPADFTSLHILPFFPSSSDDGFAVIDYLRVDHHLGSWSDIETLAERYDLMVDLVINHCSRESLWFADFVSGRDPGRHYFITLPEESDTAAVIRPRSTPLVSAVHTYSGIRHVWNTFSADQIDLNFANPAVFKEIAQILRFYVSRGARLIRLDAIAFLWKRLGTSCMSLPETHAVVKALRTLLQYWRADVRLVTETNVPHEENVSYFGDGDEAHVVYQFSLAPLLLYSYVFADASYLTTWAARLQPPPQGANFLNFIATHDGIGLRPLEGLVPESGITRLVDAMHQRGGFVAMREADGAQRPYEINIAVFSAFGEDLAAYLGAYTLLLSFQGVPAIYLHALLATTNDLALVEQTGRTRSINRGHWSMQDIDAACADPDSAQSQTLAHFAHVLACRKAQPALHPSVPQRVFPSPPGVFVMAREHPQQRLLVVASVSDQPQRVPLASIGISPGRYRDKLSDTWLAWHNDATLAPYQVLWLEEEG